MDIPKNNTEILLAEPPFLSIQGEGKTTGKLSLFLRFFGCPVKCSFCDTEYSFKGTPLKVDKNLIIDDMLSKGKFKNIVFTGGEPLLYQDVMDNIIRSLDSQMQSVFTYEIETSGSLRLNGDFLLSFLGNTSKRDRVLFNISPKVFSLTENIEALEYNVTKLKFFNIPFIFKFVDEVKNRDIIEFLVDKFKIPADLIYVMPECKTREEHLERFASTLEYCKDKGWNFSPRTHILLWDNKKGV